MNMRGHAEYPKRLLAASGWRGLYVEAPFSVFLGIVNTFNHKYNPGESFSTSDRKCAPKDSGA